MRDRETPVTFKPHHDPSHLYFITATVLGWRQIFVERARATIILDSLDWHRRHNRWSLYAYVLMPNHCHAIVKPEGERTISSVLQSFGSFTAHAILARLESEGCRDLLTFFAQRQDRDTSKQHQIWQPIQAKNAHSAAFLRQKLEYTHNNPIAEHWHLVEDRADYAYSSACFYDRGEVPIVEVSEIGEWLI
jgi:REP element-mobilizing transposase RayT